MTEPTPSTNARSTSTTGRFVAVPYVCTAILLVGIGATRLFSGQSIADATSYHERVRQVADGLPLHFGNWLGVDVPVPEGARRLLKPNVLISRRYEEMTTGRHITLLVVQCKDARDILGHYPPVCYAGQGWVPVSTQPRDWELGGMSIPATRYVFASGQSDHAAEIRIDNFMVLPSGRIVRNMDEVEVAARDSHQKYFGAAQVQIVSDTSLTERDRADVLEAFAKTLRPFIFTVTRQAGEENP